MTDPDTSGSTAIAARPWNGCLPPNYQRTKLSPLVGRRDKWWRRDAYIAIDESLAAGEIKVMVAVILRAVLSFSDDCGNVVWPSWKTIGARVQRSGRTAGGWLKQAREAGWLEREHRWKHLPGGTITGQSNLWRIVLPPAAEARRNARKPLGKNRPTARAPQNVPHHERTAIAQNAYIARQQANTDAARSQDSEPPVLDFGEIRALIAAGQEQARAGPKQPGI